MDDHNTTVPVTVVSHSGGNQKKTIPASTAGTTPTREAGA